MNIEQSRLETFHEWPHDAPVGPSRIAKAGFFFTKQQLIVECFACQRQISDWNYGDQVMTRHRSLSPSCPFVLNPTTSGNVPIISLPTIVPSVADCMKNEATRLSTFAQWPIPDIVTPERLARAGFYYLKSGDNTKCAFCKGVVRAWEAGDDPDREHRRHFEDCPFVLTEIIPRLNDTDALEGPKEPTFANLNLVANDNLQALGVQHHKGPKKSDFATIESRLRSFSSWPQDLIQTPDVLAQAGFYYEGRGDQVRCFHCDGGLRHWDPQDDPWTEHARWFPRCSFIKLVKGQDFVNACALEMNVTSNLEEVDKTHLCQRVRAKKWQVLESEVQAHLTSELALQVLGIGIPMERVKKAIREKLEQTGRGYSQADALVEAALNLEDGHEDAAEEVSALSPSRQDLVNSLLNELRSNASMSDDDKDENASQKDAREAAANGKVQTMCQKENVSLEEENRILKEARLCKICMDAEVGIVFLPCGHLTTCVNCALNLEDCPVCRSAIKATVRIFLS